MCENLFPPIFWDNKKIYAKKILGNFDFFTIFGEAEWVETSDIGKDSKNNFPFEKGGTG